MIQQTKRFIRRYTSLIMLFFIVSALVLGLRAKPAYAVTIKCVDGTVFTGPASIRDERPCDSGEHGGVQTITDDEEPIPDTTGDADVSPEELQNASGTCKDSFVFGFPTWYKYLPKASTTPCEPKIDEPQQAVLILFAVVEALTRAAAFIAFGYFIYGGFKYITSQGSPEGTKNAKDTLINAVIGLVITLVAIPLISVLGHRIG